MFKSLAAAADEWDTQRCNNLADLFSSSPAAPADLAQGASTDIKRNAPTSHPAESRPAVDAAVEESESEGGEERQLRLNLDFKESPPSQRATPSTRDDSQLTALEQPPDAVQDAALNSQSSTEVLCRDSQNRLRLFDQEGNELPADSQGRERPLEDNQDGQKQSELVNPKERPQKDHQAGPETPPNQIDQKEHARETDQSGHAPPGPVNQEEPPITRALRFLATMNDVDYTQKSAMSLTQENSSSAYAHLDIDTQRHDLPPPSSDPAQDDAARNTHTQALHWKQYNSAQTDSAAHTYKENDTGHIKLGFDEPEPQATYDEPESQDASFARPILEPPVHGHPFPPETPAPPVNPFSHKGTVLKGIEMFGATQPSSVGIRAVSPTSTRPSPDIYNDFTSPGKRMISSPLARRNDPEDQEENGDGEEHTPLQSSTRYLLAQSMYVEHPKATDPRLSSFQSSDKLQRAGSVPEPRRYNPVKESQERRRQEEEALLDAGSDESDSDIEDEVRRKRMQRENAIRQQLGAVTTRPRSWNGQLEHVPPGAALDKRCSLEDEYKAQCDGFDARDTQPDDTPQEDTIIANSQSDLRGAKENVEIPSSPPDRANDFDEHPYTTVLNASLARTLDSPAETPLDAEHVPATEPEVVDQDNADAPGISRDTDLSLPLQEVDSNRQSLRTPVASKQVLHSDQIDDAVPETSPARNPETNPATNPETSPAANPLRPMSEIERSFEMNKDGDKDKDEDDDELTRNPPGFIQDVAYLRAIKDPDFTVPRNSCHEQTSETPVEPEALSPTTKEKTPSPAPVHTGSLRKTPEQQKLLRANPAHDSVGGSEHISSQGSAPKPLTERARSSPDHSERPCAEEPKAASVSDQQEGEAEANKNIVTVKLATASSTRELRTTTELKGPSRALRRSTVGPSTPANNTPPTTRITSVSTTKTYSKKQTAKSAEHPGLKNPSNTSSVLQETSKNTLKPTCMADGGTDNVVSAPRSTRQQATAAKRAKNDAIPSLPLPKRTQKRKSGPLSLEDGVKPTPPSRISKRQLTARMIRESSEDPLALMSAPAFTIARGKKSAMGLFAGMIFAVSYLKNEQEKNAVTKSISDNGGEVLEGFDGLFGKSDTASLSLTAAAKSVGFAAVIADEHSRKPKYMQALALGLPCISGRWVLTCVAKDKLLDWSQYLLCAGQSTFLNGAHLSRKLAVYSAADAMLESTLAERGRMLEGKSVLVLTNKSRTEETWKTFLFLTRALGPERIAQVADYPEALKKLTEAEIAGRPWDFLYVDEKEKPSHSTILGTDPAKGSRKRKAGAESPAAPTPKKIRLLNDEDMVQSLIFGELIDE